MESQDGAQNGGHVSSALSASGCMTAASGNVSWLRRNWKWLFVLCIYAAFLGTLVGSCAAIDSYMTKSSDLYKEAVRRAQTDPRAVASIGLPMKLQGSVG